MQYPNPLNILLEKEIISPELASKIDLEEKNKPFSIHWELRTLLYLGITCLTSGLGVLIYKNIDTIGHNILIALIGLACAGCFYFAIKHNKPFTWEEVKNPENLADFALLGGCVLFLMLEGYLQYQYNLFGNRYGIAALIPAIVFFYCAYRFDHRGVLSMAITALASWIGVSIAPVTLWQSNNFNTQPLTVTALALGILLTLAGWFSEKFNKKAHFSFTYLLFGGNLAFVAASIGLYNFDFKIAYFLIIAVLTFLSITYARQKQSYLFLLMGAIYGYCAFTYGFFKVVPNDADFFLYQFYFLGTAAGIIYFLINIKKIVKNKFE
jgi:uncharacterized membrane-anchored protein